MIKIRRARAESLGLPDPPCPPGYVIVLSMIPATSLWGHHSMKYVVKYLDSTRIEDVERLRKFIANQTRSLPKVDRRKLFIDASKVSELISITKRSWIMPRPVGHSNVYGSSGSIVSTAMTYYPRSTVDGFFVTNRYSLPSFRLVKDSVETGSVYHQQLLHQGYGFLEREKT